MTVTKDLPAPYKRSLGTWEGTYHVIDPESGGHIDTHKSKVEVGMRGDRISQRNTYTWEDGWQEVSEYAIRMIDGELHMESESLEGSAVIVGKDVVCVLAKRKGIDVEWVDVIVLLTEDTLARTCQVLQGQEVWQIIHVEERLTSRDDVYFDVASDPFEGRELRVSKA